MKKNYGIIPAQGSRPEIEITEEYLITKAITTDLTFNELSKTIKIEKVENIAVINLSEQVNEDQFKNFKAHAMLSIADKNGIQSDNYYLEGFERIDENNICIIKDGTIQITKCY